jgi:hypothetical protein
MASRKRADSFCRCLTANKRFRSVSVLRSTHGQGFVVQFQPASPSRAADLYHSQYRQRELKGQAEQPGYAWSLQVNGRHAWYLCQSLGGEVYEVTENTCTCPDWQFRGRRSGLPCKHIHAYARAVAGHEIRQLTLVRLDLRFGRTPTQQPAPPMPAPAA